MASSFCLPLFSFLAIPAWVIAGKTLIPDELVAQDKLPSYEMTVQMLKHVKMFRLRMFPTTVLQMT